MAKVDPAIVRSGRLERTVHIPLPDVDGLAAILRSILNGGANPESPDVDLVPLALLGTGGTGADAAAWVRRAPASARRANRPMVEDDLREAIAEERRPLSAAARRLVAIHEAGHVIAAVATDVLHPIGA